MAFASDAAVTHRVGAPSRLRNAGNERAGTSGRSLRRVLDHLLEGGPVDPGHRGHGSHTDGAVLDVVELGVAPAGVVLPRARVRTAGVVGARAGPARGIAAPVDVRQLVDGGLERALQRCPARSQVPSPAVAAAAVDLGVAVRDARAQRLPQRTLQVAFPTAVVGRSLRPGRVVQRVETGEQAEAVAVIAVRARREPRVEGRGGEAGVEVVREGGGVWLVVAAGGGAVPAFG